MPTACELWDLTVPVMPQRSALYNLEPVGLGTPYAESLTSYVGRLAQAHCVHPRALILREIVPLLALPSLLRHGHISLTGYLMNNAHGINGIAAVARNWVRALEALTRRGDLHLLTLLSWAHVLTPRKLLRPTHAWCPQCYDEWRATGQVIYDPLLWAVQAVTACPRHRQRLRVQCPYQDCRQPSRRLVSRSRPGYCSRCARWLGVHPESASDDNDALGACRRNAKTADEAHEISHRGGHLCGRRGIVPPLSAGFRSTDSTFSSRREFTGRLLGENELKWQAWVVDAVGQLIAAAPTLEVLPGRESIAKVISTFVTQVPEKHLAGLARTLQVSRQTVWRMHRGREVPGLESFLSYCFRLRTSPLAALTEKGTITTPAPMITSALDAPYARPTRDRRHVPSKRLGPALAAALASNELPPPAMAKVARRLGSLPSVLKTRFPELCRAISARYVAHRTSQRIARVQALCNEVRRITSSLHSRRVYPSVDRVRALVSYRAAFMYPAVTATWHQALQELGWKS